MAPGKLHGVGWGVDRGDGGKGGGNLPSSIRCGYAEYKCNFKAVSVYQCVGRGCQEVVVAAAVVVCQDCQIRSGEGQHDMQSCCFVVFFTPPMQCLRSSRFNLIKR